MEPATGIMVRNPTSLVSNFYRRDGEAERNAEVIDTLRFFITLQNKAVIARVLARGNPLPIVLEVLIS